MNTEPEYEVAWSGSTSWTDPAIAGGLTRYMGGSSLPRAKESQTPITREFKPRVQYDAARLAQAQTLVNKGVAFTEIAKQLAIPRSTLQGLPREQRPVPVRVDAQVDGKRKRHSDHLRSLARQMLRRGMAPLAVARKLHMKPSTVQNYVTQPRKHRHSQPSRWKSTRQQLALELSA